MDKCADVPRLFPLIGLDVDILAIADQVLKFPGLWHDVEVGWMQVRTMSMVSSYCFF